MEPIIVNLEIPLKTGIFGLTFFMDANVERNVPFRRHC